MILIGVVKVHCTYCYFLFLFPFFILHWTMSLHIVIVKKTNNYFFIQLNCQVLNYWRGLRKVPEFMMVAMLNYWTTTWCGEACVICASNFEKCLQCSQRICWRIYSLHKWYGKMSISNLAECLRFYSKQSIWWSIYN